MSSPIFSGDDEAGPSVQTIFAPPVAAEGRVLDPIAPRLEHSRGDLGGFLDQRACLLVSPPAEAAGR